MTVPLDRRSVLGSLAVLGLAGCSGSGEPAGAGRAEGGRAQARPEPAAAALDLSHLEAPGAQLGFMALDVSTGRSVGWRPQTRFLYCSTFKLYLAAATLERAQTGAERLDRKVAIASSDLIPHAPTTGRAVGSTLSIEALCQAAVELSDNPAANILIREYGGLDAWRGWFRTLGDEVTSVDRLEPGLNAPDGDKDTTTPVQTLANLRRLFLGSESPLNPESQTLLLRWMTETPTGPGRIRAGAPAGWRVAHKTGTGDRPANDIGVAYPPSGEPVLIAAFHDAASGSTDSARDAVIADAVRLGLEALGHG